MATLLKQSTAVNIALGPFVDREDGASPETGLSISLSNVQVSKNGGAFAQKHQSSAPTHDVDGWYLVALDTGVTGLPVTPNGGNIILTWDASGIFAL